MFEAHVYIERRNKLKQSISSGILLFPANTESPINYPGNCFHFRQDSSFLYYFGLDTADIVGYIDVESGEELLFADELTIEDIYAALLYAAAVVANENVFPMSIEPA